MVAASTTSPLTVLGSGSLTAYWRFQRAVVAAQLQAWLPPRGRILVDISGPQSSVASQAAAAGYAVLQVMPRLPAAAERRAGPWAARPEMRRGRPPAACTGAAPHPGGWSAWWRTTRTWPSSPTASVDGVIADDGALSRHLMAEDVAAEIARVLRPGGQLLACVDSLVLGMSILAEQHHWAELTDLPQAEVVLVPWPDGRITRCFGPEQLGRPADRGRAGGQLDPAAHRAVPVHGGSCAAQGPERHHAAGPGRAGRGRGGRGAARGG